MFGINGSLLLLLLLGLLLLLLNSLYLLNRLLFDEILRNILGSLGIFLVCVLGRTGLRKGYFIL